MNIESPLPFNSFSIGDKFYLNSQQAEHWFPEYNLLKFAIIVDKSHHITDTDTIIIHATYIAISAKDSPKE
ncbi:hypothetical protein [Derxia lacustris]|uniref:hypothetical protein n=1 Tax=Derxia lacustris TaxID=764842 RepID=UPI001592EED2|nr:hypothetical protein [Derxia lacustris]